MHAPRTVTTLLVSMAAAGALLLAGCGSGTTASAPTAATSAAAAAPEASPAAPSLSAPAAPPSSAPATEQAMTTPSSQGVEVAPGSSVVAKGAGSSCINVLVVDDFASMRRIVRNLVTQLGVSPSCMQEAADGQQALQRLRSEPFAIVISDWNMEPMTGLQLLREVRADSQLKTIPFLMMLTESRGDNVAAAREAGVSNYIVKPFNAQTLGQAISAAGVPLP